MPGFELYVSDTELKDYLRADHPNVSHDDGELLDALTSACREIDNWCGRAGFYQVIDADDTPTARTFRPDSACGVLNVTDFWTVDGLVVATDDDDDGVYETAWTLGTDFEVEPADGIYGGLTGFPFWELWPLNRQWPTSGTRRRPVQVTARWGWETTPPQVIRATKVLTATFGAVRSSPTGVIAMGDFGGVRIPADLYRTITQALQPFRRVDVTTGIA